MVGPCAGGFCGVSAITGTCSGLCGMKSEGTQPLLGVCGWPTGRGWDRAGGEAAGNADLPVPSLGGDSRAFSPGCLPGWVLWCPPMVSQHRGSPSPILLGAGGDSGARMLSGSVYLHHALITWTARGESPSRSPAAAQEGSESPGPAVAAGGHGAGDVAGCGGSCRAWTPRYGWQPAAPVPAFLKPGC